LFITFEGIDGSGKSTLLNLLAKELKRRRVRFLLTREPGGTLLGDKLRELLSDNSRITPYAELSMFVAARAQLVEEVVKPALAKGETLISDRYADSTLAYQGYGRGLDKRLIQRLNEKATQGLKPDLTVLLDLPVSEAQKRIGKTVDRIERESVSFHKRVRSGYLAMAKAEPLRWLVLDGLKSPKDNLEALMKRISGRLKAD
jgi:dTMP kinase